MRLPKLPLLVVLILGLACIARSDEARNGWDPSIFKYERAELAVEESTPTAAQVDFRVRPPQMKGEQKAPAAGQPAPPRVVATFNVVRLRFRDAKGSDVPVLLSTPREGKGPYPVVVALHGATSNKAQITAQLAPALTKRGFAVLALDLPMHGERPGEPRELLDLRDPRAFVERWQQAVLDVRQCIDLAEGRAELETRSGVVLAGYSMGAIMNSIIGPAEPRVKAMVLMVGGSREAPRTAAVLPQLAALQPQLAIVHFAPRPLLMLNGKSDLTITREMAERLFSAAIDPKKQIWYDAGHLLPGEAYEDAATWVAETWKQVAKSIASDQ